MTIGKIFGMIPTYGSGPGRESQHQQHQIISDRDGSGYGFSKKYKGKFKSDNRKHAAMSALTLLAFLFFLNILQNCLREQTQPIIPEVNLMMMMPAKHIKDTAQASENDRDGSDTWVRGSRSLLQYNGDDEEGGTNRKMKFIQDYRAINWANGLSQLSEKEIEDQKTKTEHHLRRGPVTATRVPLLRSRGRLTPVREVPTPAPKYETHVPKPFIQTYIPDKDGQLKLVDNDWIPRPGPGPIYQGQVENKTGEPNGTENRNRRSELTETEEVQTVTPSVGLDLNTYKTYPVYNHYNRVRENASLTTTTTTTPTTEVDRPSTTTEQYPKGPRYPPPRNRFRFANHNRYYQPRYPAESRYKYSPYRKTASNYYDTTPAGYHVHEEYYPVAVVRNPQDDELGFDLIKFVWTMLTGFAKPLTKIVPSFAKVGTDEAQCYDLLVCEAHRVSRFMGPTAEAVASTFSTLLTWYTPEDSRQILMDAVSSGRENTCQQQIHDCDERSGGKSAMTVLAQVLEMKLR